MRGQGAQGQDTSPLHSTASTLAHHTRTHTPTRKSRHACLDNLENTAACWLAQTTSTDSTIFSSGLAAVCSVSFTPDYISSHLKLWLLPLHQPIFPPLSNCTSYPILFGGLFPPCQMYLCPKQQPQTTSSSHTPLISHAFLELDGLGLSKSSTWLDKPPSSVRFLHLDKSPTGANRRATAASLPSPLQTPVLWWAANLPSARSSNTGIFLFASLQMTPFLDIAAVAQIFPYGLTATSAPPGSRLLCPDSYDVAGLTAWYSTGRERSVAV